MSMTVKNGTFEVQSEKAYGVLVAKIRYVLIWTISRTLKGLRSILAESILR